MKNKIKHLFEKWGQQHSQRRPKPGQDGVWRGIKFGDNSLRQWKASLNSEREEEGITPIKFGGVATSTDEDELLMLPPNFTIYDPLKKEDIEIEAEVLLTKIRWEIRSKDEDREGRPWNMEWEEERAMEKRIYDRENNTMDFTKARVTDMNTCKRIHMPRPASQEKEIILGNMKQKLLEFTDSYIESNCNERGFPNRRNLNIAEERGKRSLTAKCRSGEIIVQPTDKSKRLAVMDKEAYAYSMETHVEGDATLTWNEQEKIEQVLNGHTLQFGRILRVGQKWGAEHVRRIHSALRSRNALRPPLYGLAKDHKDLVQSEWGDIPPQRPVCGAQESANGPLSDLLSDIIDALATEMDNEVNVECHSTEELLSEICDVNDIQHREEENPVIFSMDVKQLYPSLDATHVSALVREAFMSTRLDINVDPRELSLYLSVTRNRTELINLGLGAVTHTRRNTRGRAPGITTEEILRRRYEDGDRADQNGSNPDQSKFIPPSRDPTSEECRLMLSLALETAVLAVINNHMYQYNNTVRKQREGGPIGLRISGALARIVMIEWARRFKSIVTQANNDLPEMANHNIHLLKIYVDDTNIVCDTLPPGVVYNNTLKKMVFCQDAAERERNTPNDVSTAQRYQALADDILPYIKVTYDCPSRHPDGWMPVLDVKVRVEEQKIQFAHYRKPMCDDRLILARSAHSKKIKRLTAVNEGLRILRNTSRSLGWSFMAEELTELAFRLMKSGYDEQFRGEVMYDSTVGYERMIAESQSGGRPLYRPKQWERDIREKTKVTKRTSWFRPYDSVMFVPASPEGTFAEGIRKIVNQEGERLNLKIKVVERGGRKLGRIMSGTQGGDASCGQPGCFMEVGDDESATHGARHDKAGAVYKVTCSACTSSEYWGETGHSGYTRGCEHLNDIRLKRTEKSALAKHLQEYHPTDAGNPDIFRCSVVKTFKKPMYRQITEGVKIRNSQADILMNSRDEWIQPATVRLQVEQPLRF